jgi:hypothetical protein
MREPVLIPIPSPPRANSFGSPHLKTAPSFQRCDTAHRPGYTVGFTFPISCCQEGRHPPFFVLLFPAEPSISVRLASMSGQNLLPFALFPSVLEPWPGRAGIDPDIKPRMSLCSFWADDGLRVFARCRTISAIVAKIVNNYSVLPLHLRSCRFTLLAYLRNLGTQ